MKKICASIETAPPLGRLFDLDVLSADGHKLERTEIGAPERSCLVCGAPGRGCASRRLHTVEELQAATQKILRNHFAPLDAEQIAGHAERSLLDEVFTTPKPGLVDCRNNGSHRDMNPDTFRASAKALRPYFASCVSLGQSTALQKREDTFAALRLAGLQAENAMYAATGGVNTHKGMIFSLGLLCGALGRLWSVDTPIPSLPQILQEAQLLAAPAVAQDFSRITEEGSCTTSGETLYHLHGITGIRGEAAAGFPSISKCALPAYRHARSAGLSQNDAGAVTLLHLIASVHDTNLYRRGGTEGYQFASESARALLAQASLPTIEQIQVLDDAFIARNLSPGGCADLLALTYFLFSLEDGR